MYIFLSKEHRFMEITFKLNEKTERFCTEYVIDFNGKRAATAAGYAPQSASVTASRLIKKPNVKQRIKELQGDAGDRNGTSHDWVLQKFKKVAQRCMQEEPILDKDGETKLVKDKEGNLAPAFGFDASGANKALENIGKHVGFYKLHEEQSKDNLMINVTNGSNRTGEVRRRIAELVDVSGTGRTATTVGRAKKIKGKSKRK